MVILSAVCLAIRLECTSAFVGEALFGVPATRKYEFLSLRNWHSGKGGGSMLNTQSKSVQGVLGSVGQGWERQIPRRVHRGGPWAEDPKCIGASK